MFCVGVAVGIHNVFVTTTETEVDCTDVDCGEFVATAACVKSADSCVRVARTDVELREMEGLRVGVRVSVRVASVGLGVTDAVDVEVKVAVGEGVLVAVGVDVISTSSVISRPCATRSGSNGSLRFGNSPDGFMSSRNSGSAINRKISAETSIQGCRTATRILSGICSTSRTTCWYKERNIAMISYIP